VRAELISLGGEVVQPLVAAVGSLDRYGQMSVTEVFEHMNERIEAALAALLPRER
jgi:hypothetical protein